MITSSGSDNSSVEPAAVMPKLPGGVRMEVADEKQAVLAASLVRALTKPC